MNMKDTIKDMAMSVGVPEFIRIRVDETGTWVEGSHTIGGPIIYRNHVSYLPPNGSIEIVLDPPKK